MKVLCNRATKRIEGFVRWGNFNHNQVTHAVVAVTDIPVKSAIKLKLENI